MHNSDNEFLIIMYINMQEKVQELKESTYSFGIAIVIGVTIIPG